jgi:integrase
MKTTSSIFKRPTRDKKTNRLDANGNPTTATVKGGWVYRIRQVGDDGRLREIERGPFALKNEARDARDAMLRDLEKRTVSQIKTGTRMTFADLADHCSETLYKPAIIVEGRKIEGVRSHNTAQNYLKLLKRFFGNRPLKDITTETLYDYRRWRLEIGSQHPEARKKDIKVPVKLATINKELSLLRRIMRHALAKGWVTKDVFFGSKVIDVSAEMERSRILSRGEEERLLKSCQGEREVTYTRKRKGKTETITAKISADNPLLKGMILLAIDSGLRRGEILKLRWDDIDFEQNVIHVVATNTKTEKERWVPLTARAKAELLRIRGMNDEKPFPISDFKRSWAAAKRIARIDDLHFHDLRATAITRWQQHGLPLGFASKLAGHANVSTTSKFYTSIEADTLRNFTSTLNAAHAIQPQAIEEPSQLLN